MMQRLDLQWMISVSLVWVLALAAGCGGGGGGGGDSQDTRPEPTGLNGTFSGNLSTTQGGQESLDDIDFNVTVDDTLTGTFFRRGDGAVGTFRGDVTDDTATFAGTISGTCAATFSGLMSRMDDGLLSLEMDGTDCQGPFQTSGMLMRMSCVDIAGTFRAEETVTITCTADGEQITETERGGGTLTLNQQECMVSYVVPDFNVSRTGQIEDNILTLSGPFIRPVSDDVRVNQNRVTATATIVDQYNMTFTGVGMAKGNINGIDFSCTGNSTGTLRRLSGRQVASVSRASEFNPSQPPGTRFSLHSMALAITSP